MPSQYSITASEIQLIFNSRLRYIFKNLLISVWWDVFGYIFLELEISMPNFISNSLPWTLKYLLHVSWNNTAQKWNHIHTIYHIIKSIVNKLIRITLVTKLWLSAIPSNDFKDGIMMNFYSEKRKPCITNVKCMRYLYQQKKLY